MQRRVWALGSIAVLAFGSGFAVDSSAQTRRFLTPSGDPLAQTILELEDRERLSVLNGDIAEAEALRDPDFVANTPDNAITKGAQRGLERMRSGGLRYARFERVVEHVEVDGDVAVAMGSEVVEPQFGPQAGRSLQRRYTNVWVRKDGRWRLRFRHANLLPGESQVLEP